MSILQIIKNIRRDIIGVDSGLAIGPSGAFNARRLYCAVIRKVSLNNETGRNAKKTLKETQAIEKQRIIKEQRLFLNLISELEPKRNISQQGRGVSI